MSKIVDEYFDKKNKIREYLYGSNYDFDTLEPIYIDRRQCYWFIIGNTLFYSDKEEYMNPLAFFDGFTVLKHPERRYAYTIEKKLDKIKSESVFLFDDYNWYTNDYEFPNPYYIFDNSKEIGLTKEWINSFIENYLDNDMKLYKEVKNGLQNYIDFLSKNWNVDISLEDKE